VWSVRHLSATEHVNSICLEKIRSVRDSDMEYSATQPSAVSSIMVLMFISGAGENWNPSLNMALCCQGQFAY
jgi:hypothetical protein